MVTGVVRTLCRTTLVDSIASARREKIPVIVCSDGIDIPGDVTRTFCKDGSVRFLKLGHQFGQYGAMAFNVGALMAETEFAMTLDDDDELAEGCGEEIRKCLSSNPKIDIWIPGLQYSDGRTACMEACPEPDGIQKGHVACPIIRTTVLTKAPLTHVDDETGLQDFFHIHKCSKAGYKIGWIGKVCILVRPKLPGDQGNGSL